MEREEILNNFIEELHNTNLEGLKLVVRLIGEISKVEKYNINTSPERIAEIEEEERQQSACKKERKENRVNPYHKNQTMRMIGRHSFGAFEEFREMFTDVAKARPYEGTFDICLDMFTLGIICGKRIDRRRRNGMKSASGKKKI